MSNRMHILITGVTGLRNRGVEALVRPTVTQLLKRYPDANIVIATWSKEYDERRLAMPAVSYLEDPYLKTGEWTIPLASRQAHTPLLKRCLRKAARTLGLTNGTPKAFNRHAALPFGRPDLIIVSGGDLFSSDYGTASLRHYLEPVFWASQHGIPCALIGQSIGKFKTEEDVALWRHAEATSSLIILREPLSLVYLTEELGSDPSRLVVTADAAFLLDAEPVIAAQQPAFDSGPTVALSISESICKWTGNDYATHEDVWVELSRMILAEWKANIAIIPHVQETYSDDRLLSTRIFRRLGCDRRIRVYAEDLSAAEFKGIISRCEFVVAERMHAAIAGFSSGVCTVPIGYSIKAKGITAAMLKSSTIDVDDLAIPLNDLLLDVNRAKAKLSVIWTNRHRYLQAILDGRTRMRYEATRTFDLIDECLRYHRV